MGAWRVLPPLPAKRAFASSAVLLGRVVVTGGFNAAGTAPVKQRNDDEDDEQDQSEFSSNRSLVPASSALDPLAGGSKGAVILSRVDVLDTTTHTWSRLPDMLTPRRWHATTVSNDKLYAIGGFDGHQVSNTISV